MPSVVVTPEQWASAIEAHLMRDLKMLPPVTMEVCHRGQAHVVGLTNQKRLVDRGRYKAGFRVAPMPGNPITSQLRNDTPYANVIEWGRRPMRPGPPLEPILGWVRRKLGLKGNEAKSAAWAIREAIHRRGLRPHHLMRQTRDLMRTWFQQEVERRLGRLGL